MRTHVAMLAVAFLLVGVSDSPARDSRNALPSVLAPHPGQLTGDVPAGSVPHSYGRADGDTLCFGYIDGEGFAVPGDVWTFDHGAGSLEGWYGVDVTEQEDTYFRHLFASDGANGWDDDPFNIVEAPLLGTEGVAWLGAFGSEARELCWDGGLGYGNDWCQRLLSPVQTYAGSGNVAVSWTHFNDTEPNFDYTHVCLQLLPNQEIVRLRNYTGPIGLAGDHPDSPPAGELDSDVLTAADFAGSTSYQMVFELTSDGSWSDEDALFSTEYGAAAFDDVSIGANSYDFEDGLEGWTAVGCPGFGTFLGIAPLAEYTIEDACQCELDGNVFEMHAGVGGGGDHPYGQHVYAVSPPIDALNDVTPASLPGSGQLAIMVEWDQYSILPRANGVFYRPGATYYPFLCELTGEISWSERIGQDYFFFVGEDPTCSGNRNVLTRVDGEPLPSGAEQIRIVFEVYASCDAFGIEPEDCTQTTNFTPIIDNLQLCFTRVPRAPNITIELGLNFQDGFAQRSVNNYPGYPGRADVSRNINFGNTPPFVLGDSLQIAGPLVTGSDTSWESHFWFRIARTGPRAAADFTSWVSSVNLATGVDIEAGEFAPASMDSAQLGTAAFKNKFTTYLKEEDWAAWGRNSAGPELSDEVEIIPDDILYPGTQVEYFLTSNYLNTPGERFYLPDTTGGFFREFEILPGWRDVGGGELRFPSLLYVDAFNDGAQVFIQSVIDSLGFDVDRYDYLDATSNWKAPMARGGSSDANNGCQLTQLLGYRGILVNTGSTNVTHLMWPEDYEMFDEWLTTQVCDASEVRQGLVMNGDGIAQAITANYPVLLARMGAWNVDSWYADYSGNDDPCVRIETPLSMGELYGTENSVSDYEYDAFGNWCPQQFRFDVLGVLAGGSGNRAYLDLDDFTEVEFAAIVNEEIGQSESYRTVVDGVSWHHLVAPENGGLDRCVTSEANISAAMFDEIAAAIEWIYEVDYDQFPALVEDLCRVPPDAVPEFDSTVGGGTTRLLQNSPNPFNPRTSVRFTLARSGQVEVSIFDAGGRKVRTLVRGELDAGPHDVLWDGADDSGRPLASGVYWTQLTAGGRTFNKNVTILR